MSDLLPIREVRRRFAEATNLPTTPPASTVAAWRSQGVRGHILPARRIGGRYFVEANDLEKFIEEVGK